MEMHQLNKSFQHRTFGAGQFLSRGFVVLLRKSIPQNHNLKTAAELGVIRIKRLSLKFSANNKFLMVGGLIAGLAALWHLLMIIGGPDWYAFARALRYIVESAREGTFIAPVGAVAIAMLMFTCAAYAFSGAGLIRKIPLLNLALPTISFICLARGLYFSPVFFSLKVLTSWHLVASSVWFFVGICFLLGTFSQLGAKKKIV